VLALSCYNLFLLVLLNFSLSVIKFLFVFFKLCYVVILEFYRFINRYSDKMFFTNMLLALALKQIWCFLHNYKVVFLNLNTCNLKSDFSNRSYWRILVELRNLCVIKNLFESEFFDFVQFLKQNQVFFILSLIPYLSLKLL
jgi:hypothetical protein